MKGKKITMASRQDLTLHTFFLKHVYIWFCHCNLFKKELF